MVYLPLSSLWCKSKLSVERDLIVTKLENGWMQCVRRSLVPLKEKSTKSPGGASRYPISSHRKQRSGHKDGRVRLTCLKNYQSRDTGRYSSHAANSRFLRSKKFTGIPRAKVGWYRRMVKGVSG